MTLISKYNRHFFYLLICFSLFIAVSCVGRGERNVIDANVLVYWPTDESDHVYHEWTSFLKQELRRHGVRGDVTLHFAHANERWESLERSMMNDLVVSLRSQGKMPDIIISYGDVNRWLITTNQNSVISSIPVVCFGLSDDEFLPYMYDLLENKYNGGRFNDVVNILSPLHLKENIMFADSLSPILIDYIRKPEYYLLANNRFITMLDVPNLWCDSIKYNMLCRQADEMDTARFYNNLVPKVDEYHLRDIAANQNRTVLTCRSIMAPKWNISIKANQIATTWAFYPQKSPNLFIQSKHDQKSENIVNSSTLLPYYTMVAEDFLVNQECIGGFFPDSQTQIRDAVSVAVRILEGEDPDSIGTCMHEASYNINWDVVRPLGLDVNNVPCEVKLHNVTFRDRQPHKANIYRWILIVLIATVLISSTVYITYYVIKSRRGNLKIKRYSEDIFRLNAILKRIMDITDFHTWEDYGFLGKGDWSRLKTNNFFIEKLRNFISITTPGNHSLRLNCSIDGKPYHWYSLMMTVSRNENDETIKRSGFIVNIDSILEYETKEAEINRLKTSVKTREGFIASMNHEIRTPLNSIVGYAQLLSMPEMPVDEDELAEYTEAIDTNSAILQHTLDNILTALKISKSAVVPIYNKVNIGDLLKTICSEPVLDVGYFSKGRLKLIEGPADLLVTTDSGMLTIVVENLISNAVKFSESSSDIVVGWNRSFEKGWAAEIWVRDYGIGIEPQYQKLIYERFFKVDSFTTGCGLGLFICKTFIELIGGSISVESIKGEGSVFKIKLGK